MCKNEITNCKYGSEKCWFIHTGDIEQAYESAKNVNKIENVPDSKNATNLKT